MEFAIETIGLSKAYRDFLAGNAVNLMVKPGEIYGFPGLNGAGETTTIRVLPGMGRPSAGGVCIQILIQPESDYGRGFMIRHAHR